MLDALVTRSLPTPHPRLSDDEAHKMADNSFRLASQISYPHGPIDYVVHEGTWPIRGLGNIFRELPPPPFASCFSPVISQPFSLKTFTRCPVLTLALSAFGLKTGGSGHQGPSFLKESE